MPSATRDTPASTEDIPALQRHAEQCLARGDVAPAQQACLKILHLDKQHADGYFLLGMVSVALQRFSNAREFIEKARELDPSRVEYTTQLARCLAMLRLDVEAAEVAEQALAQEPKTALTLDTLGVVLSRLGKHEEAVEMFRQAVREDSETPSYYFNLASSLKFLGQFEEAERAYEAALNKNPRFYKAHSALSQLRRQTPKKNHIRRLEGLLRNVGDNVAGEVHLRHALAKELEDLGEYSRSFEHLRLGKQRRSTELGYESARDRAMFDALTRAFPTAEQACQFDTSENAPALFVVGMPRTGTTLVERILSSHSKVSSAGELQTFGLLLKRLAETKSPGMLDPETIARSQQLNLQGLGNAYVQAGRRAANTSGVFVDKMPLNFLYAGFIRRALPNARMVCLLRHPMDTVLSNFRQLFSLQVSYYDYAYTLEDIARYHLMFRDLLDHWDKVLPELILRVNYEDLVANQVGETERLLSHCGLGWEEACLDFTRNTSAVATASAVQVRESLYTRAVHRWKNYERELEPARRIFEAAGLAIT